MRMDCSDFSVPCEGANCQSQANALQNMDSYTDRVYTSYITNAYKTKRYILMCMYFLYRVAVMHYYKKCKVFYQRVYPREDRFDYLS